jgi:uncharacterized protein (DUF433 family)
MDTDIFRTPILTARETARYLRMPESTLDVWLRAESGAPLVHAVTPARRGWPRVPFVGVVEAYVLRCLRDLGLSMAQIRIAAELVRDEFGNEYALASKRVVTDGVTLFVTFADEVYVRARDRQQTVPDLLRDSLKSIEWDDDGNAARLQLRQFPATASVIIDPRFGWGSPVLARNKVRVDDVIGLWRAGESMKVVAEEYDLPVEVVEDVLREAA